MLLIVRLSVGYVVFLAERTAVKSWKPDNRFHLLEACEWESKFEVEAAVRSSESGQRMLNAERWVLEGPTFP